jgi:hypothetical protein
MRKERGREKNPCRVPSPFTLFFDDSFNRADLGTGSTFRAFLLINHIRFALFNGLHRTFLRTGSAGHAFFSDDVSHFNHLPFLKFRESLFP